MLCPPRLLPVLLLSLPLLSGATTPARVVDLRFGMPTWHQPLGAPDDWHKPMADWGWGAFQTAKIQSPINFTTVPSVA